MPYDITQEINELPPGLERALLRILSERVGRENAIGRKSLLVLVQTMPGCRKISDRQLRLAINQQRKAGKPICSAAGEDGGYYWAANWIELDEFLTREMHSRAMDLLEQEKCLRQAAEKRWGAYSKQLGLF